MKEFRAVAINPSLVDIDGKLVGFGELIVVLSEPSYSIDAGGDMIRSRGVEQVRFGGTADALRRFAEAVCGYATDLDKLAARHKVAEPLE